MTEIRIKLNWNGQIHDMVFENQNVHEIEKNVQEIFHLKDNFTILVETPKREKLCIDSDKLLQMYASFCTSPELLIQYEEALLEPHLELANADMDKVENEITLNDTQTFESLNLRPDVIHAAQQYYCFENLHSNKQKFLSTIISGKNCVLQDISEMSALISYQIGILQAFKPSSQEMELEVVVLCGTREAARNRALVTENMGKYMDMKIPIVIGGENLRETIGRVKVKDYSTIFATSGRLLDILQRRVISLDSVKILILDGLDEMLQGGLVQSIVDILRYLSKREENTIQFIVKISTMNTKVQEFINKYFQNAVHLIASKT